MGFLRWAAALGVGGSLLAGVAFASPVAASSEAGSDSAMFQLSWNRLAAPITSIETTGVPDWAAERFSSDDRALEGRMSIVRVSPRAVIDTPKHTCTVDTSDPRLDRVTLHVVDVETGQVLDEVNADQAVTTASTAKIVTAAVALRALGADTRLRTTVTTGSAPGQVVLVGAGDAMLSAQDTNWYGAPNAIAGLADQLRQWSAANQTPITSVAVDGSLFDGPDWAPSWKDTYFTSGTQSRISALTLDGGRRAIDQEYSVRSDDPAGDAGRALAGALGLPQTAVSAGTSAGQPTIASVEGLTISEQVRFMLRHSDNTLADTLARLSAGAAGKERSFSEITSGYEVWLERLGVSLDGSSFADGSGLSHDTKVSPKLITGLLRLAALEPDASALWGHLALGDDDGSTMKGRFKSVAAPQRHEIHAKTGTLEDVISLAGGLPDSSGRTLVFFVAAEDTSQTGLARAGIDDLVASLAACQS